MSPHVSDPAIPATPPSANSVVPNHGRPPECHPGPLPWSGPTPIWSTATNRGLPRGRVPPCLTVRLQYIIRSANTVLPSLTEETVKLLNVCPPVAASPLDGFGTHRAAVGFNDGHVIPHRGRAVRAPAVGVHRRPGQPRGPGPPG